MTATTKTANAIHVRVWSGSLCVVVTDMTNAGKRGKTCRTLRGRVDYSETTDPGYGEVLFSFQETFPKLDLETSFDDVLTYFRALAARSPSFAFYEETIRAIEAPREKLLAGVEGEWSASADEGGICVADLTDRYNDPRSITDNQSEARAYEIAKNVWPQVQACETYYAATEILRKAGANLHSYCAVD